MSERTVLESPEYKKAQQSNEHIYYAGFWLRFWAYLIDLMMIFSLNGLFIKPIFRLLDLPISTESLFTPYAIVSGLVFYLYFVLTTKIFSQTIGKMIFGLKVVSLASENVGWSTVVFRELIGRYISATIILLYLVVAFTNKKQGLHDLFADTVVIGER